MRPAWQKIAASLLAVLYVAVLIVFRGRMAADFWPPDASRVGPNLVASAVLAPVLFIVSVLLWPPTRRRLHRFMDAKLNRLHRRLDALDARHDQHAESLAALHAKFDELTQEKQT